MDTESVAEFWFFVSLVGLLLAMCLVASIFAKDPEILQFVATCGFPLAAIIALVEVVARTMGETRGLLVAIGACFMAAAIVSTIRLQMSRRRLFPGSVGGKVSCPRE